jgi:DNA ligase-1
MKITGPVWLMQPIPYLGEKLKGEWIYEPKIDGWRLQIIKTASGDIKFYGRRLEKDPDWTVALSYLIPAIKSVIPSNTILDGELTTPQGRRFIPTLFSRNRKVSPLIYLFDVIYYKGKFLGNEPLKKRKEILFQINFEFPFQVLKFFPLTDIKNVLQEAISQGHEGIVIKELFSPYRISKQGPVATEYWRKIKPC